MLQYIMIGADNIIVRGNEKCRSGILLSDTIVG